MNDGYVPRATGIVRYARGATSFTRVDRREMHEYPSYKASQRHSVRARPLHHIHIHIHIPIHAHHLSYQALVPKRRSLLILIHASLFSRFYPYPHPKKKVKKARKEGKKKERINPHLLIQIIIMIAAVNPQSTNFERIHHLFPSPPPFFLSLPSPSINKPTSQKPSTSAPSSTPPNSYSSPPSLLPPRHQPYFS